MGAAWMGRAVCPQTPSYAPCGKCGRRKCSVLPFRPGDQRDQQQTPAGRWIGAGFRALLTPGREVRKGLASSASLPTANLPSNTTARVLLAS